jgi:predicted permease
MSLWLQILTFLADLVLPITAGYWLTRQTGLTADRFDPLMRLGIVTAAPALTLLTFWGVALEPHLIWLPIFGVLMLIVPGALSLVTARFKTEHGPLERGSYVLTSMLANRGVVGGLATYILFGEQGYAWSRLVIIFGPVIVFFVGFPLAGRYYQQHTGTAGRRGSLRRLILNPNQMPVVGIIIGLLLNVLHVDRPQAAAEAVPILVHVVAWLLLLPTGAGLRFKKMAGYLKDLPDVLAIKFLLNPLLFGLLAWAVGFRGELWATVVLLAASPTAIFTVVVARAQGLNTQMAMAGFVATTVVYLTIVLPVFLIANALLG